TILCLKPSLMGHAAVAKHCPLMAGPRRKVNVSIAAYLASLLLFGAPVAVALVGASQLVGQATLALRRDAATSKRMRSARSVLFNTSQLMVGTGLGGLVYYSLLPHLAPAPLDRVENLWAIPATTTVLYLANSLAVAVMIGLQLRQSPAESWLSGWRTHTHELVGLFLIGLMTAIASIHYPWSPLLMALP